ncbi:MAG: HNH endonuclease signature motif containing protein, partial [Ilumatobacteraceae bacterium]
QGRITRLATRQQRRALRAMYKTCAIPECTVASRSCQPHHIWFWRNGGPTDLDNLIPLCSKHHHCVHEGGWHLVLASDRSLTITFPDGSTQRAGPPRTQWAGQTAKSGLPHPSCRNT